MDSVKCIQQAGRAFLLCAAIVCPWLSGAAPGRTGGPGDVVGDFFTRDPLLPPPERAVVVRALALSPQGEVLLAGSLPGVHPGTYGAGLWRSSWNGRLTTPPLPVTSPSDLRAVLVQPDGRVLAGGSIRLDPARFRPRGVNLVHLGPELSMDHSFTNVSTLGFDGAGVLALAVDGAGHAWAGGGIARFAGTMRAGLVRLNLDGTPDATWESPFEQAAPDGQPVRVRRLLHLRNGGLLVGGAFITRDGRQTNLVRLTGAGLVDPALDAGRAGLTEIRAIGEAEDGGLWVADDRLHRLLADGTPDPAWSQPAAVRGRIEALVPEGDAAWIAGTFDRVAGQLRVNLARVERDGRLTSGTPGAVLRQPANVFEPAALLALARDPLGRLLVGGVFSAINGVERPGFAVLEADGQVVADMPRTGFHASGHASRLASAPGGRLLVAGGFHRYGGGTSPTLALLAADGGVEASFRPELTLTTNFIATPQVLVVTQEGAVITAGYIGNPRVTKTLVRLLPDGRRDTRFGPDGTDAALAATRAEVTALARLGDGRLLVGGSLENWAGLPAIRGLHRLEPDGRPDPGWRADLPAPPDSGGESTVLQLQVMPDGSVAAGGYGFLVRLDAQGRHLWDAHDQWPAVSGRRIVGLLSAPDGGLVVCSHPWSAGGDIETIRFLPDGRRDPLFIAQPWLLYGGWPDGRLLLGSDGGTTPGRLLRCFAHGAQDGSFAPVFERAYVRSATVDVDGAVLAGLLTSGGADGTVVRLRGDSPTLSRLGRAVPPSRPPTSGRWSIQVHGPPGQTMVIEWSADLDAWQEWRRRVMPANGTMELLFEEPAGPAAFFRARPAVP